MGLSCLAQSEPLIIKEPDEIHSKPRRFVRVKPSRITNGIENSAFQDTEELEKSPPDPTRSSADKTTDHIQSGVRRKSPNESVNSENSSIKGGTKKKVRPNVNAKSPSKEYYQIWTAENPKVVEQVLDDLEEAPPLPPRALHRPLERSHAFPVPPVVLRHQKPKKNVLKPEDSFGFELIDVDEPITILDSNSKNSCSTFLGDSLAEKKLKSPKKTIGSDNYITTVLPKKISSPKNVDNSSLSNCSSSSEDTIEANPSIKPHKPLSRQISNASTKFPLDSPVETPTHKVLQKKLSSDSSSSESSEQKEEITNNLTGTPLRVPKKLEKQLENPLEGTPVHRTPSFRSEPIVPLRPHPKALERVAGIASNLPVCPPTPTHHARKLRNKEIFKPPSLKSFDPSPEFEIVTSPEIKHADIRSIDTLDGWAGSKLLENTENACACEMAQLPENIHKTLTKSEAGSNFVPVRSTDTVDGWVNSKSLENSTPENTCCCKTNKLSENVHKTLTKAEGVPHVVPDIRKTLSKPSWSLKVGESSLRSLGDLVNIDTRPPDVRSQELSRPSLDIRLQEPTEDLPEGQASGGSISLPLRHLTSTRLPSIPERSPRVITLDSEHEEPLPPCKSSIFFLYTHI